MSNDLNDVKFIMNRAESMVLEFNTASGAGYVWECNAPEGLWVRQINDKKETSPANGNSTPIGGNTSTKFMIMAEWSGEYELTFTHKRPWSDETAGKQTFKIHVR